MSGLNNLIERHWQHPYWWLSILLLPLSFVFSLIIFLRSFLFRAKILAIKNLPIPVVIVGNINVGGVGKTPILITLATQLTQKNLKVGIVSRGYGRKNKQTLLVDPKGDSSIYGDEPLMIAQKTGVPIAVSTSRYEAGLLLLKNHPDLSLILSDDGLQHYALARDIELLVVNQKLGLGNGYLLPQGPLRESPSRLKKVSAIICTDRHNNKNPSLDQVIHMANKPLFSSQLFVEEAYRLDIPEQTAPLSQLAEKYHDIAALAGIGVPQKFYDTLQTHGVKPKAFFSFPDHHDYREEDLPKDFDIIITTQKDATKLQAFGLKNLWVLPISVEIEPNLTDWLIRALENKRKTITH